MNKQKLEDLAKSHINFSATFTPDIVILARRLGFEVLTLDTDIHALAVINDKPNKYNTAEKKIGISNKNHVDISRWLIAFAIAKILLKNNDKTAFFVEFGETLQQDEETYLARHLLIDYSYVKGYIQKYHSFLVPSFEMRKLSNLFKVPLSIMIDVINDIREEVWEIETHF